MRRALVLFVAALLLLTACSQPASSDERLAELQSDTVFDVVALAFTDTGGGETAAQRSPDGEWSPNTVNRVFEATGDVVDLAPEVAEHVSRAGWVITGLFCDNVPTSVSFGARRSLDGDLASLGVVLVREGESTVVDFTATVPDSRDPDDGAELTPLPVIGTCLYRAG